MRNRAPILRHQVECCGRYSISGRDITFCKLQAYKAIYSRMSDNFAMYSNGHIYSFVI